MIKFTESDPEDPDILIKTTVKEMTMRKKNCDRVVFAGGSGYGSRVRKERSRADRSG